MKKVKCIECDNFLSFAIPSVEAIKTENISVDFLRNSIVCSRTMKTKTIDNCQYCKNYIPCTEFRKNSRKVWEKELEKTISRLNEEECV